MYLAREDQCVVHDPGGSMFQDFVDHVQRRGYFLLCHLADCKETTRSPKSMYVFECLSRYPWLILVAFEVAPLMHSLNDRPRGRSMC